MQPIFSNFTSMKHSLFFLIFVISFNSISYSQGKIKEAEDSLKDNQNTSNNSQTETTYTNSCNAPKGNFLTDVIGGLFIQLLAYTAYGIAIESPFETTHLANNAYLTKHPYKNSETGNFSYYWNDDTELFTTSITTRCLFETNRLYGYHLNADLRFFKRFGLELDYLQLWEENPNFGNNTLAIYTALAKYNRIRTEHFNAYWGLGASYINGDVNALGFTYGLGAEWFFIKPFSLASNFNQILVNDNTVNKFNGLLNYHRKQYKFIGGYEYLKIGNIGVSNVSLGIGIYL
ncbi:MAG: hypothetical protein ABJM36_10950 [Algibacter sp.]|uniref:hypothetical protein n=1 Tax=Algibacter sp. TaxID=1872428 RepID=UPI00329A473C